MRKKGAKGAPTAKAFARAKLTVRKNNAKNKKTAGLLDDIFDFGFGLKYTMK